MDENPVITKAAGIETTPAAPSKTADMAAQSSPLKGAAAPQPSEVKGESRSVDDIMKGKQKPKKKTSPKFRTYVITFAVILFVLWRVGVFTSLKDYVPTELFSKKPPEKQMLFSVVFPYREPALKSSTGELAMSLENKGPDDATVNKLTITNIDTGRECQLTTKTPLKISSYGTVKIIAEKCSNSGTLPGRIFTLKLSMDVKATKRSKLLSDIDMELNSMQKMDVPMDNLQQFFQKRKEEVMYMNGGQDLTNIVSGGAIAGIYT
jgi:hypothetical protein